MKRRGVYLYCAHAAPDDADPVWEAACLRWWWSACSVLSGPSLSGASPLPQGYAVCVMPWRAGNPGRGRTGSGYVDQTTQIQCGRGLAPDGGGPLAQCCLAHRHRGQAPSHRGMRCALCLGGQAIQGAEGQGSGHVDQATQIQCGRRQAPPTGGRVMPWRAGNSGRGRTGSGYVDQTTQIQCGRGLAPDGGGPLAQCCLAHRYRGQAPSHRGMWCALCLGGQAIQGAEGQGSGYVDRTTQIQCGRGLACDGGGPLAQCCLAHRYRGQAPSHRGMRCALCLGGQAIQGAEGQGSGYVDRTTQIQCGRGLACDGGGPLAQCCLAHRYRGQAPSHRGMRCALCLGGQAIQGAEGQGSDYVDQTTQIQCGRGLAPDGGVSADIIID